VFKGIIATAYRRLRDQHHPPTFGNLIQQLEVLCRERRRNGPVKVRPATTQELDWQAVYDQWWAAPLIL